MNRKQIALAVVLVAFLALDVEVIYNFGYLGFFRVALSNSVGVACMADLVIALGMICIWMAEDARARGISFLPYLVVTFALGSVGPLLYLIRRFANQPEAAPILAGQPLRN